MTTPETSTILTFEDKVKILSYLMDGAQSEFIADLYSTTVAKINEISENHHQIIEVAHYFNISQHLAMRRGIYPRMENVLYCWFIEQNNVSNKALGEKAKAILSILNERPILKNSAAFTASNNWIRLFKARYGLPNATRGSLSTENDSITSAISEPKFVSNEHEEDQLEDAQGLITEIDWYDSKDEFKAEAEQLQAQGISAVANDHTTIVPLTTQQSDDDETSVNNEEWTVTLRAKKRKRSTLNQTDDQSSSSDDFSDYGTSRKRKKRNGFETVLVPSKKYGVKSMNLQVYKENKVIRIFKPLLKYAKYSGWSEDDSNVLVKLYEKSLKSCGGGKATQSTITQYFKKMK